MTPIAQLAREQDRIAQRAMWRRFNKRKRVTIPRVLAMAAIMAGVVGMVAMFVIEAGQ